MLKTIFQTHKGNFFFIIVKKTHNISKVNNHPHLSVVSDYPNLSVVQISA